MKKVLFFAAAMLSVLILCAASAAGAGDRAVTTADVPADADGWLLDFEAAQARAKALDLPVFLKFTGGDRCDRCQRMDRTVFSRGVWKTYAAKHLVTVKAGFPQAMPSGAAPSAKGTAQDAELAKRFGVERCPAYLIFAPDGRCIGRMGASENGKARRFVRELEKIVRDGAAPMPAPDATDADGWMFDFDAAQARAKALKRPLLVQFTGSDWCGFCMLMDRQVFSQPAWKTYAAEHLVLMKADMPAYKPIAPALKARNEALSARFGVRGLPTYLLFDADGRQIGSLGCDRRATPASFIGDVRAKLGAGR